jgi:hypothetical protein
VKMNVNSRVPLRLCMLRPSHLLARVQLSVQGAGFRASQSGFGMSGAE